MLSGVALSGTAGVGCCLAVALIAILPLWKKPSWYGVDPIPNGGRLPRPSVARMIRF
ncbi:exported protein of unknown function [Azospirillum baldaniorum]|uniref:Uncharacterized protein n=1 Tax=Azospirillum baldaniorum TaxID=1064539 RepID=A0A9P1JRH2_9PROT|nr:exported protein of unknown function [Azospirillum baldaniorum]